MELQITLYKFIFSYVLYSGKAVVYNNVLLNVTCYGIVRSNRVVTILKPAIISRVQSHYWYIYMTCYCSCDIM